MENQVTSPIIKGSILGVISIVLSVVVYVFNLYDNNTISYISSAITFGGLIYGAILYSNQNQNKVTFGNIFADGFKTTAVFIVISSVYTLLAFKVIFPDMLDKVLEMSRKKMLENPKMTDEMVEQAMAITTKYFIPFALGGIIIVNAFLGAAASLIGAFVAKKSTSPFDNAE